MGAMGGKALELQAKMEGESDYRGSVLALKAAMESVSTLADMLAKKERAEAISSASEITVRVIDVSGPEPASPANPKPPVKARC